MKEVRFFELPIGTVVILDNYNYINFEVKITETSTILIGKKDRHIMFQNDIGVITSYTIESHLISDLKIAPDYIQKMFNPLGFCPSGS